MSKYFIFIFIIAGLASTRAMAQCPNTLIDPTLPQPLLKPVDLKNSLVRGKLSGQLSASANSATVRLCINGKEVVSSQPILPSGTFEIKSTSTIQATDKLGVQVVVAGGGGPTYGPTSTLDTSSSATQYVFIGGVEQSGFSSLAQSTDPFIQIYIEGPPKGAHHAFDAWGRIRLLGAPQPSTNGIASTFTDPTGTITKLDFTKVGESIDIVAGTQVFLNRQNPTFGQTSFIAWAGTTTPLSSQTVAYTFKAPAPGTIECQQLLIRFTPALGYNPGLTGDPTEKSCLVNGTTAVTDIAFANQDRTNFLFKWGAGIRTQGTLGCSGSRPACIGALAILDATVGQDAAVTRGIVRHFVAKADGVLPIPTGDSSYLYLFGSVYTRFTRNTNASPLILAAETSQPTLPNPAVVVLPLIRPDREFFRLGVGINLKQIFAKLFSSSTNNSPNTTNSQP